MPQSPKPLACLALLLLLDVPPSLLAASDELSPQDQALTSVPDKVAMVLTRHNAKDASETVPGSVANPPWESGITMSLEGAAGLRGGRSAGQALHGLLLGHLAWQQPARTAFDGGLSFRAFGSVLSLAGRGPSERFIGDFLTASNTEGYESTRLYATWIEADYLGWSLRAGALLADEEFAGTEGGSGLFSSAFGWPAFISANTINTGPAFYVPAAGLRISHTSETSVNWRFGIYDGDTFDSAGGDPRCNRHGWGYRLGGAQGAFAMGELEYPLSSGARIKAGGWLHTAKFADLGVSSSDPDAASRQHWHNFGAYAVIEHTLTGEPGKANHISAFIRAGGSPPDRNTLAWVVDSGLRWNGPLSGRPADIATLGLAHGAFSRNFAAQARAADSINPPPDYERVFEINYSAVLSERFRLQPDLQFIRHPGGSSALRDAVVLLLRFNADL